MSKLPMIVAVIAGLLAGVAWPDGVWAQSRTFDGPFVALDIGSQNVIGGSLIDGTDVLQQATRPVITVGGGWRREFGGGFVASAEIGYGRFDGSLQRVESAPALQVNYHTNAQWHWGLSLGHTISVARRRAQLFAYLSEVSRTFDVDVVTRGTQIAQRDEQGLLRYGGGAEVALRGPWRARVMAGTSRADFGDRRTNITPSRPVEVSAGLIVQF